MPFPTGSIRFVPFFRIILPVVAGIVVAGAADMPLWTVAVCLAVTYVCAWLVPAKGVVPEMYLFFALFFSAMLLHQMHRTRPVLPQGGKLLLHLEVTDNPFERGRWNVTTGRVGYYRDIDSGDWHKVDQKILLSVDTCYAVQVGDRFICGAYVNPVGRGDTLSGYARLMNVRGFWGSSYITPGNMIARAPEREGSLIAFAKGMQRASAEKLARLRISPDAVAVATTMATGERRMLSPALRESYSKIGASHLLAVSGLHVGIVFALVNCLLWLLPGVRRGHIIKNIAAIAAIWLFTLMTGLSPSAVRAALMFSGAQIALAATLHRNAMNILLAAAAVMLLMNPNNLYDVSFQLSFAAVLFIGLLYRPLYGMLRTRYAALNFVTGIMVVGFAATLGTAPLVAYYFHNFPLAGLLINVPVIVTANIVVLAAVAWIMFPAGFLAGAAGWVIDTAASAQNAIVEWGAGLPGASFRIELGGWGVAGIYIVYLVILILFSLSGKRKPALLDNV